MLEPCGISSYDMCIADYQFLLHKLRVVTYGSDYKASSVCPYCGSINDSSIDLDSLNVVECSLDELNKHIEFDLPKTGKHIRLSLQTPRTLDDVSVRNKEIKKKSRGVAPDSTLMLTLVSLVSSVDGKYLDQLRKKISLRICL
jgi:hypothetical protein